MIEAVFSKFIFLMLALYCYYLKLYSHITILMFRRAKQIPQNTIKLLFYNRF